MDTCKQFSPVNFSPDADAQCAHKRRSETQQVSSAVAGSRKTACQPGSAAAYVLLRALVRSLANQTSGLQVALHKILQLDLEQGGVHELKFAAFCWVRVIGWQSPQHAERELDL